jgi:hypothetical protein
MSQTFQISANAHPMELFEIPANYHAVVTVSGTWSFDPNRNACGAAGVGGPISDGSFPRADAPVGCLFWTIAPPVGQQPGPQDTAGWFTSDNQTIDWGGTSPGNGRYSFGINDNQLNDNTGQLALTVDIQHR